MFKLTIYGSSSKGNCYLLSSDTTTIMLDCGVKRLLNLQYDKIDGILLTHLHSDHCGGIKNIKNYYGNKYYANKETLNILPTQDFQKQEVKSNEKFNIGDFTIMPFELIHDVPCLGYLIKDNVSNTKFIYITDTGAIPYEFKDIDYFLIESNCDEDLLTYEDYKQVRLYDTHLSMQQTAEFLKNNVNHNTKRVILGHISSSEENYKKHEEYVKSIVSYTKLKVDALDPHMKEPIEIVLKEDIQGFDFD